MQPEAGMGDAYLVARAQDGYLDAYELLVQRHAAMAYRVALRLCGNHHDAQDVAQEALIAAWENLDRLKTASFSTWLYQIVTRRALNKVTRARRSGSLDLADQVTADAGPDPAAQAERGLAADAVTAALASLPFAQRAVIVLHHFEGLSYAEVAEVTHSTVPAVRSHLHRARRTLAARLNEWR